MVLTSVISVTAAIISARSVTGGLVDDVDQRLAGVEASEIVGEQRGRGVPVVGAETGDVGGDDDVWQAPQRTRRIERLVLEDVKAGTADDPFATSVRER